MNGLKLIRTRCNYSQAALAEKLGVSRQAINMWENAKKAIPDKRKKDLCAFFGIENKDWFDEIDNATADEICKKTMYKGIDEVSEHFHFSPTTSYKYGDRPISFENKEICDIISLDERCSLKRIELKALLTEIQEYVEEAGLKNSYERITRTDTTTKVLGGMLDALKTCMEQSAPEKMPYVYVVFAVVDALNIALGNITIEDVTNSRYYSGDPDIYDDTYWSVDLSDEITKRIERFKTIFAQNGIIPKNDNSQA